MQNQPLILAGGALVVGVLLAVAISGSRIDSKLATALERAEGASASALEETTADLTARIEELEAQLAASAEATSASLDERVAALRDDVASRIDAVSQAAESSAEDLQSAVGDLMARIRSAGQSSDAAEDLAAQMETAGPFTVGQTAIFMDGAVRAFVAALDRDEGAARLNVNGETVSLGVGETASLDLADMSCDVGLVALDDAGATVGSNCGTGGAAASASVPPAPEEGFTAGSTAQLADGALRVFVSGLAADGSSARLAINGTDLQTVSAGSTVTVDAGDQSCDLTVTGVGNGIVGLSADCG